MATCFVPVGATKRATGTIDFDGRCARRQIHQFSAVRGNLVLRFGSQDKVVQRANVVQRTRQRVSVDVQEACKHD